MRSRIVVMQNDYPFEVLAPNTSMEIAEQYCRKLFETRQVEGDRVRYFHAHEVPVVKAP